MSCFPLFISTPTVDWTRNVTWYPFSLRNLSYLFISEFSYMDINYRQNHYAFWREYYPQLSVLWPSEYCLYSFVIIGEGGFGDIITQKIKAPPCYIYHPPPYTCWQHIGKITYNIFAIYLVYAPQGRGGFFDTCHFNRMDGWLNTS